MIHKELSSHLAGVIVFPGFYPFILSIFILSIGILQPYLQLLQCLEAMRDLVLLFLVHFGIPKELSKTVRCPSRQKTYVCPSYSKIGSQPTIVSKHLDFQVATHQNAWGLVQELSCPECISA